MRCLIKVSTKKYDVIIIGAGASGLMCAITAAERGRSVLVIEHANKVGKKILMSGGGRCNFTNTDTSAENFISHNPHFCKSALSSYTAWDFLELVNRHDIDHYEKTPGQYFCRQSSKPIVEMLLAECDNAGVEITLNASVENVEKNSSHDFLVQTNQLTHECKSLVIATGGLSIPTMGASPFAYKIAEQFSLKVWPTRAGLVPLTLHQADKERLSVLSGTSIHCSVATESQSFTDDMLYTHRGLSGPAMLQISSYWQAGKSLKVRLLPDLNLEQELFKAKEKQPKRLLKNTLTEHFSKNLVQCWLTESDSDLSLHDCSKEKLHVIAESFQAWIVKPNATEGYRTAEVTLGGVDTDALSSKTFEVKSEPGLYFIGEALDVTGWLGGFNFQWAWSSGYAAGSYC